MMNPLEDSFRWVSEDPLPPVFEPADTESCRTWIQEQNRPGSGILIAGGGSQLYLGNPPTRVTSVLSLRRWSSIEEHVPGDLTVTVQAGCRFSKLQDALLNHGQFLPFFPLDPSRSTIGGIVASGVGGIYAGSLGGIRNFLIGIKMLHPDGRFSHAGGKVVKNVAGYDLCKLYTGSLGSLGVICSLTFKVRPTPQTTSSGLFPSSSLEEAVDCGLRLRDRVDPAALELIRGENEFLKKWAPPSGGPETNRRGEACFLALRFLDAPALQEWKWQILSQEFPGFIRLDTPEETAFWDDWRDEFARRLQPGNQSLVFRLSAPASLLAQAIRNLNHQTPLEAVTAHLTESVAYCFSRPHGSTLPPLDRFDPPFGSPVFISLFKADREARSRQDGWGPTTQPLKLMRRIKDTLDPHHILNPGRMWGGI